MAVIAGLAHHQDDLFELRRIGRILHPFVARRPATQIPRQRVAGDRRLPAASTNTVDPDIIFSSKSDLRPASPDAKPLIICPDSAPAIGRPNHLMTLLLQNSRIPKYNAQHVINARPCAPDVREGPRKSRGREAGECHVLGQLLNFLMASSVTGVKRLTRLPSGSRNRMERLPQGIVVGS